MVDFDNTILERLLNSREGPALDFKREQYRFNKANPEVKSELLKDILSFANSPRDEDAYILIGVKEAKAGRSEVIGVSEHLDDASLHQFVTSKTKKPAEFNYIPFEVEGKEIGVIKISVQDHLAYIENDYGKVREKALYIRDGSSTRIASPDEIVAMGRGNPPKWAIDKLRNLAQNAIITVVEQWRNHPYRHRKYAKHRSRPTYQEAHKFKLNRSRLLEDYESGVDSYGTLHWVFKRFDELMSHCNQMFRTVSPSLVEYGMLTQAMIDLENYVEGEQLVWEEFRKRVDSPHAPLPGEASYNLLAIAEVAVRLVDALNSGNLREDPEYETRRRLTPVVVRRSRDWGEWRQ